MMDAPSEPPRVVVTPVTLGGGLQSPPFMSPHMAGGAAQRPFSQAEGEGGFSLTETGKKKRGRPRKYGPDGNVSLALSSGPGTGGSQSSGPAGKKRGRPVGGGKKQQLDALGICFVWDMGVVVLFGDFVF